jgi:hypothetical protein
MGLARGFNIGALLGQTPLEEKAKGKPGANSSVLQRIHKIFACI